MLNDPTGVVGDYGSGADKDRISSCTAALSALATRPIQPVFRQVEEKERNFLRGFCIKTRLRKFFVRWDDCPVFGHRQLWAFHFVQASRSAGSRRAFCPAFAGCVGSMRTIGPIARSRPAEPSSGQQGPTCSLQDIGNALQTTYNGFTNGECAAACDNSVTCALAVWATVAVGAMGSAIPRFLQRRRPGEQLDRRRRLGYADRQKPARSGGLQTSPSNLNLTEHPWLDGRRHRLDRNALHLRLFDRRGARPDFFRSWPLCSKRPLLAVQFVSDLTGGWISVHHQRRRFLGDCNQLGCAPAGSDGCPILCNSARPFASSPVADPAPPSCPPPMVLGTAGPDNPVVGPYQEPDVQLPAEPIAAQCRRRDQRLRV